MFLWFFWFFSFVFEVEQPSVAITIASGRAPRGVRRIADGAWASLDLLSGRHPAMTQLPLVPDVVRASGTPRSYGIQKNSSMKETATERYMGVTQAGYPVRHPG